MLEMAVQHHENVKRPAVFVADVTGREFQEQAMIDDDFEDADASATAIPRRCTDDTHTSAVVRLRGKKMLLEITATKDGTPCQRFVEVSGGDISRGVVKNAVSTGNDPDNEFEYDLYDQDGTTLLAESLIPEWEWAEVDHTAAPDDSHALYYTDEDGDYHIILVAQVIKFEDCEEETELLAFGTHRDAEEVKELLFSINQNLSDLLASAADVEEIKTALIGVQSQMDALA